MDEVDVVIIGAGAVGLAVARRLYGPDRQVVVIERHARYGMETSSRNSEGIHAGFYYPAGTLKARLCVAGRRLLYDFCRRHGIFCRKTGKLVAACSEDETAKLEKLYEQGQANGVEGLRLLTRSDIGRMAPGVSAVAGLWSDETGIINSEDLMRFYWAQAQERGAIFLWNCEVKEIEPKSHGYRLHVQGNDEPIDAHIVINAAGLNADTIAQKAGINIDEAGYRLFWFNGEYFSLRKPLPIIPLIYPLPSKHGLGIHLTIDRQGRHRLGPNAFAIERAQTPSYDIDPSHREVFWKEARRYLPAAAIPEIH